MVALDELKTKCQKEKTREKITTYIRIKFDILCALKWFDVCFHFNLNKQLAVYSSKFPTKKKSNQFEERKNVEKLNFIRLN